MCRECRLRRLLQLHEKLPEAGRPKSSGPSDFWRIWHLLTTLGVAFVNNIECECFRVSRPKSPPLSSENKLVFRFANQQKHVLLCWQNDGRNPKLSSGCSSLSEETLKCLWTGFYFKTNRSVPNHCTYQWWQLIQAAKRACTQSWQPLSRWWHFCRL